MDSIQLKIAKIQAGAYNINDICDVKHSLCNIQVSSGRAIVAMKYKMSPLEVTDVMKVDREVPKSIYVIALPVDSDIDSLGYEVILDMSYGAKGVALSSKITNLENKLVDVLGGEGNIKVVDGRPVLDSRSKIIIGEDGKVEFWECNLINLNQIGGVIY